MKPSETVEAVKQTGKEILERGAKNRTGAALSPQNTAKMIEAAKATVPPKGTERDVTQLRIEAAQEAGSLGSVPPPVRAKGMMTAAGRAIRGEHLNELIDKLGARLAFERAGVRLYDALLTKMESASELPPGMSHARALEIRNEEASHVQLVRNAMEKLGADPTAVTPGADAVGVISMGLPQLMTDPRAGLEQCLEAILVAELADNDGWMVLIEVARLLGQDELAEKFRHALEREEEHLRTIRTWVAAAARKGTGVAEPPEITAE